ncbi:MAG TPA: hypothetical protein ENJ95_08890 [Bacteroidetes bacterium]|nr:hypothetical protein [Bacteroidota bacterium]
MLKIKVKAGSITNLTDARYFAAREVEWLGFPLGTGEGLIEPIKAKAMAEWVDGVKIVGEFGFSTPEEIRSVQEYVNLDAVQVGMFASREDLAKLKGLNIIKEIVVDKGFSKTELEDHFGAYADRCSSFLLNMSAGGYSWKDLQNGNPFPPAFLKSICKKHRIILNLDCPAGETIKMISETEPYALAFSGSGEEKTGFKSFDKMDELLDCLEIED